MSAVIDGMAIDLNNLDKSSWKTYRFDEIAQNISERVDPNNTDLMVYIGLEHLDSGSIHIKRSGTPDDVNGQKLRFYKGDVIFGRRRAYQRKAGVATTDGFCSAHALVLRANPDVIDPELFPFFLHSDLFMNRAVDISVGSLSPTINWGTLKHQEFHLPPRSWHKHLLNLFVANEDSTRKNSKFINSIKVKRLVFEREFFNYNFTLDEKLLEDGWDIVKAKKICTLIKDGTHGTHGNVADGPMLLSAKDISDGVINVCDTPRLISKLDFEKIHKNYQLQDNDLLITIVGTIGNVAIIKGYDKSFTFQRSVGIMRFSKNINSDYIYFYMRSIFFQKEIQRKTVTSVQSGVYLEELANCRFIVPSSEKMEEFVQVSMAFDDSIKQAEANLTKLKELRNTLINKVF